MKKLITSKSKISASFDPYNETDMKTMKLAVNGTVGEMSEVSRIIKHMCDTVLDYRFLGDEYIEVGEREYDLLKQYVTKLHDMCMEIKESAKSEGVW